MPLIAYNLTGSPVTLAAGNPPPVLPASSNPPERGPGVNVTAELANLSEPDQDAISAQAVDTVTYVWTTSPEYELGTISATTPGTGSGGNVVVWAPFEDPGDGYFTSFSDAHAAAAVMQGPVTFQIRANPDDDMVTIPGGVWAFNGATTFVGTAVGADTDTSYRGYQELLYVVTEGDVDNPTWLKGVVGVKDMFFRATDYNGDYHIDGNTETISDVTDNLVTFTKSDGDGPDFLAGDVGKPIRIGEVSPYYGYAASGQPTDNLNNTGTFIITEVVDADTIKFYNYNSPDDSDANNGNIGWSKCTSVFIFTGDYEPGTEFTVDNVDFRFGSNYDWGSLYVWNESGLFIHETNAASIRWFSCIVDGYLVIQSDGSGCWIGTNAFAGNGYVDVFPMAGAQVRTFQGAINGWTLHQPYIMYIPGNTNDWSGAPTSVFEALDQLAARVKALEPP